MRDTSGVKRGGRGGRPRGTANKRTTAFKAALWKTFQVRVPDDSERRFRTNVNTDSDDRERRLRPS